MTFDEYQKFAKSTALFRETLDGVVEPELFYLYPTLGLAGEAGEVAEKVKKLLREKKGVVDEAARAEIIKELGDVLWYLAVLSDELGITFDRVAEANVEKLSSRKERGALHGSGDNR